MPLQDLPPITSAMTKYQVLGIGMNANPDEIHRGYRRMAMLYHPDRHAEEDAPEAEASFRLISAAFQVLSDSQKRSRYDRALASGRDYIDDAAEEATINLRDVLRDMEEYEDPRDTSILTGKHAELNSIVAANLIQEIGEHIVDAWPMGAAPLGAKMEGSFKTGAAVLTNVRLLLPFTSQWVTTKGNVKTTHTSAYLQVCALHLTTRIELEEEGKLKRTLRVSFVQEERTVSFKTERRNLGKLLLVARRWAVPVKGTFEADQARERKWALGPIRWIPWVALAYLVVAIIGYFMATEDDLVTAIKHGTQTLHPIGTLVCSLCLIWSVFRLRQWILTYRSGDLSDMLKIETPPGTSAMQRG